MSQRRLAAIMFTDIVGYTSLMGRDENRAFEVLKINREIHNTCIKRFEGTLIKEMGDGILASFASAYNAVKCAIEIMDEVKSENIKLRIGIHEGEVVFEGSDVLGDGVNIASRLEELAPDGSIYISEAVYRNIKNKTVIKVEFIEEQNLKNVAEPVKIYKIIFSDLEKKPTIKSTIHKQNKIPNKLPYFIGGGILFFIVAIYFVYIYLPKQPDPSVKHNIETSIAILPFKNLSEDKGNQYFCDGVMEEILNHLSSIKDLRVASRTSMEKYRETTLQANQIGLELNVDYLLETSVFKSENRIRVITQLIDTKTDDHIWSQQYNRELKDVFAVMSEISLEVASKVSLFSGKVVQAFKEDIGSMVSGADILWVILAVTTAWSVPKMLWAKD